MEFPPNTNKGKEKEDKPQKPRAEKVVKGEVLQKKRSIGKRLKGVFFGGDSRGVARYVAADVLLPAFRNLIVDATSKGVERMIYGESSSRRRPTAYGPRVAYHNPNRQLGRDPRERSGYLPDQGPRPRSSRYDMRDLVLVSKEEADLVVERLLDIVDKYDVATVADLYDLIGVPTNHVDNKWGWSALGGVEVRQVRDGYLIDLPPVEEI